MKKLIIITLLSLFVTGCSQFPTRFERIEPDALRCIAVTFQDHAEGAPGDTMRLRTYFAGEKTSAVGWRVSYDCIMSQYGKETVLNVHPLPLITTVSYLPDSIDISFVIPDSVFFKTLAISTNLLDTVRKYLPASMNSLTQQDMAAFLKDLGTIDFTDPLSAGPFIARWGAAAGITGFDPASMERLLSITGGMVLAFSINGKLFIDAVSKKGATLETRKNFTIRYNSRFAGTPFAGIAPVNRNPAVRWIGIYKVRDFTGTSFSPADPAYAGKYTFSYIFNEQFPWKTRDTILIENKFSYFLCADSGSITYSLRAGDSMMVNGRRVLFPRDTVISDSVLDHRIIGVDSAGTPRFEYETYFYNWQYQPLSDDLVTMPRDSLFVIEGVGAGGRQPPMVRFLPSIDKKMAHARLWVSVYDNLFGELYRPVGFTVRVVDLYFNYAE